MPFDDRGVQCVSCGVMFVFSAGEQQFFQEKGFINAPKHCKLCKAKKEGAKGGVESKRTSLAQSAGATQPSRSNRRKANLYCAECVSQNRPTAPNIVPLY